MSLATGDRLGIYEVLGRLGAGGMGEVFRARDSRLGREVALKVVRRDAGQNPDQLARFEREARLLASLNHPNIATIHGLDEADGVRFIVLELVPGPTLAERLHAGPIPLEEACALARQIAEALEVAHERGIVHRDLKPSNIKITPEGRVKVLDFGLGKELAEAIRVWDPARPTIGPDHTAEGMILGTPSYMSPEQARAHAVDRRADVWAFGCVFFEMLTGRRAFPGDTVGDILVAVLDREPNWTLLPPSTPPALRDILQRCLRKNPERRLRDIRDVRIEIEEGSMTFRRWPTTLPIAEPLPASETVSVPAMDAVVDTTALPSSAPSGPPPLPGATKKGTSIFMLAASGVVLVLAGIGLYFLLRPKQPEVIQLPNPFQIFQDLNPKKFFKGMPNFED